MHIFYWITNFLSIISIIKASLSPLFFLKHSVLGLDHISVILPPGSWGRKEGLGTGKGHCSHPFSAENSWGPCSSDPWGVCSSRGLGLGAPDHLARAVRVPVLGAGPRGLGLGLIGFRPSPCSQFLAPQTGSFRPTEQPRVGKKGLGCRPPSAEDPLLFPSLCAFPSRLCLAAGSLRLRLCKTPQF